MQLEARLTATTTKLNTANQKLAEHENGDGHHQSTPASDHTVTRRMDEIKHRVEILELTDQEMETTLAIVQSDMDRVGNVVKKTDLISKVSRNVEINN